MYLDSIRCSDRFVAGVARVYKPVAGVCPIIPLSRHVMWLSVLALVASAAAQIPSLGWCPDYMPMRDFNMKRYLGTWYEAERYFTVSEIVSRCVTTKYESTPEGRILVSNEITNSLTGLKRVMEGHLQVIGREGEGRVIVKYAALPIPYDTEYVVLDTDYENWAVMWSCSGIGPVHTQNAWVLTRERLPPIPILQAAYGVLDRFKISRTFFVKTPQADCSILPKPAAADRDSEEEVLLEQKSVVDPEVVEKDVVVDPVEKRVHPKIQPEVVAEVRSAVPEASKPLPVPELIMSESEKKEEKMEKKEEFDKKDKEKMPEKLELPEKMEKAPEKFEKIPEKIEKAEIAERTEKIELPEQSKESSESKEKESKESLELEKPK